MKHIHPNLANATDIRTSTEIKSSRGIARFFPKRFALLMLFCVFAAFARAQSPIVIDGFVYDDGNGIRPYPTVYPLGNKTNNGAPVFQTFYNAPIYVYLLNAAHQVLEITQPNAVGHFVLNNGFQGISYVVTTGTINFPLNTDVSFFNYTLPDIFYRPTAEGDSLLGDGFPDYAVPVSSAANVTLYLGIDRRPVANDYNIPTASITYAGNGRETFPAAAFTGSDPEDGVYAPGFATRTVRFFPATGGQLYYNNIPIAIATSQDIPNFNVSLLQLALNPVAGRISFSFSILDSANIPQFAPSNITVQNPLPVILTDFKGKIEAGNALLQWTTGMEINNDGFDIERSMDGKKFTAVGVVKSRAAFGNSNWELSYSFTDPEIATLSSENFYYRLKQTDVNGVFVYSKSIKLNKTGVQWNDEVNTYPNPSTGKIYVNAPLAMQQEISVYVVNMTGQVMSSKTYSSETDKTEISMDISSLPKGSYFLKIKGKEGLEAIKKIELL